MDQQDYRDMDGEEPHAKREFAILEWARKYLEEDLAGEPVDLGRQEIERERFQDGICSWYRDVSVCVCATVCTWYPFAVSRDQAGVLPFKTAALLYSVPWFLFWLCVFIFLGVRPKEETFMTVASGVGAREYSGSFVLAWFILVLYMSLSVIIATFRVQFKLAYGIPADYFEELILAMAGCKICMTAQDARHSKKYPVARLEEILMTE
eukprot:gb/GEZN01006470.1/.p1 GENE.gb/GEZN01006470.1/~~gb/GEZN01006470.1/.p1  ORF type:complete len:208 (+),score=25.39 gb/GEZN01006470.1/:123-746(+)